VLIARLVARLLGARFALPTFVAVANVLQAQSVLALDAAFLEGARGTRVSLVTLANAVFAHTVHTASEGTLFVFAVLAEVRKIAHADEVLVAGSVIVAIVQALLRAAIVSAPSRVADARVRRLRTSAVIPASCRSASFLLRAVVTFEADLARARSIVGTRSSSGAHVGALVLAAFRSFEIVEAIASIYFTNSVSRTVVGTYFHRAVILLPSHPTAALSRLGIARSLLRAAVRTGHTLAGCSVEVRLARAIRVRCFFFTRSVSGALVSVVIAGTRS